MKDSQQFQVGNWEVLIPILVMVTQAMNGNFMELLEFDKADSAKGPVWSMWVSIFGFQLEARELSLKAKHGAHDDHVASSMTRDLVSKYEDAFRYHEISLPVSSSFAGKEFVHALLATAESLAEWVGSA